MWTSTSRLRFFVFCLLLLDSAAIAASDRVPAVAGQFYPASPVELQATLKDLFSRAERRTENASVRALILPHAGYVFSGQVAASGVNQIDPQQSIRAIFLIGVSHNAAYDGAAVYTEGGFLTPLGRVPVDVDLGKSLLGHSGLFLQHSRAHAVEHSLEVQLPLLQYHLKKPFKIVPILLGTSDPAICERIAEALRPHFSKENLFIVSTDLSHYPSHEDAVTTDRRTIDAVLSGSPQELLKTVRQNERSGGGQLLTSMCGLGGVLVLQEIVGAAGNGKFAVVQYRNSGDVPAGEKDRVVGYAAIKVTQAGRETFLLRSEDKRRLLEIARSSLAKHLATGHVPALVEAQLSEALRTPCGAFVTLKKRGELRGCIGNFSGTEMLARTVQRMALAAATEDPRFAPVSAGELAHLDIEISVLSPMQKVTSPKEIELGRHGVYIQKGNRAGTFLPQVAKETGWSLEEFLGHCAQDKAGIGWEGWRDADVFVYEAIVFGESDDGSTR